MRIARLSYLFLQDSLGGTCRTVMIANVGPCHMQYEDTHNTLKYANRAKNIKTKIVRNVLSVAHHISKYTQIIQDLRAEVTTLKTRLADNDETTVPSRGMDPKGELQVRASDSMFLLELQVGITHDKI